MSLASAVPGGAEQFNWMLAMQLVFLVGLPIAILVGLIQSRREKRRKP